MQVHTEVLEHAGTHRHLIRRLKGTLARAVKPMAIRARPDGLHARISAFAEAGQEKNNKHSRDKTLTGCQNLVSPFLLQTCDMSEKAICSVMWA